MADERVLIEHREGVALVTLNRPDKLNSVDLPMLVQLGEVLAAVARDRGTRALALTGAGRAFCAGGDRELQRRIAGSEAVRAQVVALYRAVMSGLDTLAVPVVAAVNGPALGIGAELVGLCDLVVMSEGATLGDPHVPQGLPAAPVLAAVWPQRTGRAIADELLRSGRRIEAGEALRIGLADKLVPAGEALAEALRLAGTAGKRALRPSLAGL